MLLARSAPEGEADEIAMNPDIDTRRSAVGGKADVPATWPGSPLLAISRNLLVRRVLLGAFGPDRLAACLGDLSMRLPQVRKARSLPPRAHDDTGPGRPTGASI